MNEIPPERPVQHRIIDRFTLIAAVLIVASLALYLVEFKEVNSLPAHPLFVHIPVVLLPLAAIAGTAIAWMPTWRRRYLPAVILVSIAALAGAVLSVNAGEALREAMNGGGQRIADHAEAGDKVPWAALAVTVNLVALRVANRYRAVGKYAYAVPGLSVLLTIVSLFAIGAVFYAGDSGASAVWND